MCKSVSPAAFAYPNSRLTEVRLTLSRSAISRLLTPWANSVSACRTPGWSCGVGRCGGRGVVGGHSRVPRGERLAQGAVERAGADLHQPVGAELRPLHLLLLGEALVDHDVDRGFYEGGRDRLTVAPAFAVVRDDGAVVADVAGELGGGFGEARPVGIGALQRVEVLGQVLDPAQ